MALQHHALAELRASHRGDVITPGDGEYESARRVWNRSIDKRPACIVRPSNASDVAAAVRFGRDQGLPVAVRGGAHSIAGRGTCDDGIVIDCSSMKAISVDPEARTARAEPGVRWTEFDRETQRFGLATTGGTIGDTGIAGLTLGGGFGWLGGTLGMTVDNLLAADVVLASGEQVRASAVEHPDLFWALRGGGGNFGVVTAFEYRLHPVGPMIVGGMVLHPFAAARDVLTFFSGVLRTAPDQLTVAAALLTGPDGKKACALVVAYNGPVEDGVKAVAPIKAFGTPVMDAIGPLPYLGQQGLLDNAMPPNLLNYWKAEFVPEVTAGLVDMWVNAFTRVPSAQSSLLLFPIHGVARRVPVEATAFPHRHGVHAGIYALWDDPTQTAPNVAWVRETWHALKPFAPGGVYVNELGEDEGEDRVQQAYGSAYARLRRIKAQYDPHNLFCLNANITPAR